MAKIKHTKIFQRWTISVRLYVWVLIIYTALKIIPHFARWRKLNARKFKTWKFPDTKNFPIYGISPDPSSVTFESGPLLVLCTCRCLEFSRQSEVGIVEVLRVECLVSASHLPSPLLLFCFSAGHGFKLSPVVGKILSQLALDQMPSYDMSPFKIRRFDVPKSAL